MKKLYTKGDWHACRDGKCKCKTVRGDNHPICVVEAGEWGDSYPTLKVEGPSMDRTAKAVMEFTPYGKIPEEEAIANAVLIALAPKLVDELLKVQDVLLELSIGKPMGPEHFKIVGTHNHIEDLLNSGLYHGGE